MNRISSLNGNEVFTEKERSFMALELVAIAEGESFLPYDTDNFINFDTEQEPGGTVANYVSGAINPTIKKRRRDGKEGPLKEPRLNPKEVRNKNKRQAFAVMGSAQNSAEKRLPEIIFTHGVLTKLHKLITLTPDNDSRSASELILGDAVSGARRLEAVGRFAWELDKTGEQDGEKPRFVAWLDEGLDKSDDKTLALFIAAARTNTGVRKKKYERQVKEFSIAAEVWRKNIAYDKAYPVGVKEPTTSQVHQTDYIEQRAEHVDGPARYSTE